MRIDLSHLQSTILLCIASYFVAGGAAAASIESLVMPGEVISGHAELEQECSNCHDMFNQGAQQQLCLDCHEPVALDLEAGVGFHGRIPSAAADSETISCTQCHSEHQGRNADITGLQPDLFDHSQTDFELTGGHVVQACNSCHQSAERYAEATQDCVGCHEADDVHAGNLDTACSDCHQTDEWRAASFDHDTTEFELLGSHQDAECLGCHRSQLFEAPAESTCASCHRLDDVHGGERGTSCGDCHGSTTWEVSYDHLAETGFELVEAHASLECSNCHLNESDWEGLPTTCSECHNADDIHLGRNGNECSQCHGQTSWESEFDHLGETGFAIEGTHAELNCNGCHSSGLDAPLIPDCVGCHEMDDPHEGTLETCNNCHGQVGWLEDQRFHHDQADFSLVGMHRAASCEQCHDSLTFSPIASDCLACHEGDDSHAGAMGTQCEACHNPVGWNYTQFDHTSVSDFPLTNSHESLNCIACHTEGSQTQHQSGVCSVCHRSDDVHRGGFGQNCDRCHTTTSFRELIDDL